MLNKKMAGLAVAATLTAGSVQALTISNDDFFGAFGSTTDVSTDISETLSVDLFGSTIGAGSVLTNVLVEIRGSLSTEGTYTNNGPTPTGVSATVLATTSPWLATEQTTSAATDHVFAPVFTNIIDESLGVIGSGVSGTFGTFTNDSGWLTVFNGMDAFFDGAGTLDYLFETTTISSITGSSNFASSFTTGSAGGLRVTYTYDTPPPPPPTIPEPAGIALLGLGFCMLGLARRKKAAQ